MISLNTQRDALPLRVLGFDSWTGGAHNFYRLLPALNAQGIDYSVLHIGSWGSDPGRPVSEMIGGMCFRDVRAFGTNNLLEVLDRLKPDAVLFLSTETFAHRAFNRYCMLRGVPTLHLYHGLINVQDTGHVRQYKLNLLAQLRFVVERIPKMLCLTWPTYCVSLLRTRASFSEWTRFLRDIICSGLGVYTPRASVDSRTDLCCVYAAADRAHAEFKYRLRSEQVFEVGNPDLVNFGLESSMLASRLGDYVDTYVEVMYVDTGLIFTGWVFQQPEQFIAHLVATRDELSLSGRRLIFKPHPRHLRTDLPKRIAELGIEVCSNADFVPRLLRCCAAIVEPSTASVIPALLGMPLMLAQYGQLAGQRFGSVLNNYPRVLHLDDITGFEKKLQDIRARDVAVELRQWIDNNCGPLPADRMPHRVAGLLKHLIVDRKIASA